MGWRGTGPTGGEEPFGSGSRMAPMLLAALLAMTAACGHADVGASQSNSSGDAESPVPPVEFNVKPQEKCDPVVTADDAVRVRSSPKDRNVAASERLAALLAADQQARSRPTGPDQLSGQAAADLDRQDAERRAEVLALLRAGRLSSGDDMHAAATIFNHGRCLDHFAMATVLAAEAVARGSTDARRAYAVHLDRYLLAAGKQQKFGTQMRGVQGQPGGCEVAPVDPATTDEERRAYGVEPLAQLRAEAASGKNRCVAPPSGATTGDGPGASAGGRAVPSG